MTSPADLNALVLRISKAIVWAQDHRSEWLEYLLRDVNCALTAAPREGSLWVHQKTGGAYRVIGEGWIEATETEAIIYQAQPDGRVWIRPKAEFYDGRFRRIPEPTLQPTPDKMDKANTSCPIAGNTTTGWREMFDAAPTIDDLLSSGEATGRRREG